jgi:hypothetical protein
MSGAIGNPPMNRWAIIIRRLRRLLGQNHLEQEAESGFEIESLTPGNPDWRPVADVPAGTATYTFTNSGKR